MANAATIATQIVDQKTTPPDTVAKTPGEVAEPKEVVTPQVETEPKEPEKAAAKEADGKAKEEEEKRKKKREESVLLANEIRARRLESARLKAERTKLEQERALYRNEEGRYRSLTQAVKEDPLGFLESQGVTAEQVAERVMRKGEPEDPKELARRIAEEAKLQAKEEVEKILTAEREAAAKRRADTDFQQWQQDLVKAASDPEKAPSVAVLWGRQEILDETRSMAAEAYEKGLAAGYTAEEIRDDLNAVDMPTIVGLLESRASKKLEALEAKILERQKNKEPAKEPAATQPTPKAPASGSKTLTNQAASEKGGTKVPLDRLSEAEQNKLLAEEYRRLRRQT